VASDIAGLPFPDTGNTAAVISDDPWLEAAAGLRAELDSEARDEAYEVFLAEAARGRLVDRSGPATVLVRCGVVFEGVIGPAGDEAVADHLLLVETDGRALLVPARAIVTLTRSRPGLRPDGPASPRSIGSWLRQAALADQRVRALTGVGRWAAGRVAVVGADHVDLGEAGRTTTVAFGAVDAWSLS
jgi:hypothetical protein